MNAVAVVSRKVPDRSRMKALPSRFGNRCFAVECAIFSMAGRLIEGYSGGYWEFYSTDNGGFYMVPSLGKAAPFSGKPGTGVTVKVDGNGYSGEMSEEAAGIVVSLMAYSNMSMREVDSDGYANAFGEVLSNNFHAVRDFALDHAEASAIFAAID